MREPAKPGREPGARTDAMRDSRTPVQGAGARSSRVEGRFGAPDPDGCGDEQHLNDAWLVEHARHGDHQAFAVLVRRYERKLIRVLMRLVREPEQARDLAQETFWRVYTRLDRFDTARRFGPWLFRVGVNLSLDWLRSTRTELPPAASIDRTDADGQATFEVPDPDPRIQAELAQEVQFILSQMPVSYRTMLVLRDLEGFSTSEVAAIVGRREATVRWRLAKARDKFREIWQRRHDGAHAGAKEGKPTHGHDDGQSRV
jgi:RNA polymerase sigma-70 factor, ECF subfamily